MIRRVSESGEPGGPTESSLQSWVDLIASGVDLKDVELLGLGGGKISAVGYRVALALGATVGVVKGNGTDARAIRNNPAWSRVEKLTALPGDPHNLRAFIGCSDQEVLQEERKERLRNEDLNRIARKSTTAIETMRPSGRKGTTRPKRSGLN